MSEGLQIEADLNQRWPGILRRASDPSFKITRLPTGILSIDILLHGGVARGRHTELFGSYGVGKTYLAYKLIATSQAEGHRCAFVDVEGSFDPDFAEHIGADLDALYVPERDIHANRIVDLMEALIRSHQFAVIVLDSIAALLPKAEQEQDMEAGSYGTHQAKLMSAALRRLTTANSDVAIVYINQTREAIGSLFKHSITSGGKAMGFYSGTRLELWRYETLKREAVMQDPKTGEMTKQKVPYAHRVGAKVEKDKTGNRPGTETSFVFDYDIGGVDHVADLIMLGRKYGLVVKDKLSYVYGDEKKSIQSFTKWLREDAEAAAGLEKAIRDAVSG